MSLFEPIFDAPNRAGVRYIVVGGLAAVLHGFARLTADVDLIVALSPAEDPANPKRSVDLFVETPVPFDDLWARAENVSLTGTEIRVAAIPDLMQKKWLAGRPQDLMDIEALEQIMRRRAGHAGGEQAVSHGCVAGHVGRASRRPARSHAGGHACPAPGLAGGDDPCGVSRRRAAAA